jgi:hypothetical protein
MSVKLFQSQRTSAIVELALALFIILFLVIRFQNSDIVSPDGVLYHESAHNLVDGDGYHDNIRNDFILPPVGHPLVILLANSLGVNSPLVFARILLFLGLFLVFFTMKELKLPRYYRLLVLPLVYGIIPIVFDWGVEISIFFSISLMLFCVARFTNHFTIKMAVFLGLSIALNLLIRPVYAPFVYLAAACLIVILIRHKRKAIPLLVSVSVALIIVNGVMLISKAKYGDKRLSAGTYSEIPLYCANNEYLDLQQDYYSDRWSELSEEDYAEALAPLKITTTWEDRASTLKGKVISFYKNHPGKAIGGIYWRATKFSFRQPNNLGNVLFFGWLFLCGFTLWIRRKKLWSVSKENSLFLLGFLLAIYTVGILSLFVYVGDRYNLTTNLVFIFSIAFCLPTLRNYLAEKRGKKSTVK